MQDLRARIRSMVESVERSDDNFGVLSTGEKCAVALVLERADLARRGWGTLLECAARVGPDWLEAAVWVQRDGWQKRPATPSSAPVPVSVALSKMFGTAHDPSYCSECDTAGGAHAHWCGRLGCQTA